VDAWPAVLSSDDPDAACFRQIALPPPADAASREALKDVRAWEIRCP
jgi:hypothetical protein